METERIYRTLQKASHNWLDVFKIAHEPHAPKVRTRKWKNGIGPIGVAYHFTGGPSGLKSARWFNDPGWGNEVSSCHVLIFDRLAGSVAEVWMDMTTAELRRLFPVPTIILADWRWGTWCTNWANGETLGVEMRNCGYNIKDNGGRYHIGPKTSEDINGRCWENYSREQVAAAINIGRLARGMNTESFDEDWILGHQCVSAVKADPGPIFPIELVRHAVTDDRDPSKLEWLEGFPEAPTEDEDTETWWEISEDVRDETEEECWTEVDDPNPPRGSEVQLAIQLLANLGYNVGPALPSNARYRRFLRWYQRSTHYYGHNSKRLEITGIANAATLHSLRDRLDNLHLL